MGTSGATSAVIAYSGVATTAAAAFTSTDVIQYYAPDTAKGAGSTITNQTGFLCENLTQGGTLIVGYRGKVASGAGKWNLYMDGTASSYHAGSFFQGATAGVSVGGAVGNSLFTTSSAVWGLVVENTNAAPIGLGLHHSTDSNGAGNEFVYCVGNATLRASIRSNGGLANFQANNVDLSTKEAKEAFEPVVASWDKVQAVRASIQNFKYKDATNKDDDSSWCCSPMAEDIEPHFPEYVVPFDKEGRKGVRVQPLMWELMANLIDEVAALRTA